MLRLLTLSIFLTVCGPSLAKPIEEGAHCVSYAVKKTVFFVKTDLIVGRNCDVAAQVLPEVGGKYSIEVNIPLRSFVSGDTERDRDVMKILKSDKRPDLTFRAAARPTEEWRALFQRKIFELEGYLMIGENSFPLKFSSEYIAKAGSDEIRGRARVRFADFGIRPPKVALGIISSAESEFELHFNLLSQRILGADSLELPESEGN